MAYRKLGRLSHQRKAMLRDLSTDLIINERSELVSNAIKIYCKSIFDALEDGDVSLIRFYRK